MCFLQIPTCIDSPPCIKDLSTGCGHHVPLWYLGLNPPYKSSTGFLESVPKPKPEWFVGLRIYKALYNLKQSGRAWYHPLCHFLISQGFIHNPTLPCIFTYCTKDGFVIIAAYVDDLNIIGTPEMCKFAQDILTRKLDMKCLGPTTFYLGLQVHHMPDGIFLHQQAYVQKMSKMFQMEEANDWTEQDERRPVPTS